MPASEIVTEFQGLRHGRDPVSAFSDRRALDTPRELVNLLHDEHQHLWMPAAATATDEFYTFATGTRIRRIVNIATANIGQGLLVQKDTEVSFFDTSVATPSPVVLIASLGTEDTVWVNATDEATYIGTPANTWKVVRNLDGTFTVSNPAGQPHGFHSYSYRGRRFVLQRNQTVKFSEINQPETFLADSWFEVGGDQTGGSWEVHPGSVVALMEYEDVLLIFMTNSVWVLTGSSPENFRLRRTNSLVGAWARDTLVRVPDGIMFVGGTPRGEMGVYLFSGNQSIEVGEEVGGFFRDWTHVSGSFTEANSRFHAIRYRGRYLLSARGPDVDRQVYAYALDTRKWSTLGGFSQGPALALGRYGTTLDRLFLTNGLTIYETFGPMLRAPSAPAGRVVVGWHDQGRPSGFVRFLGLKVGAWSPAGAVSLEYDLRVPMGNKAAAQALSVDFHDHQVLPVNLRGHALEADLRMVGSSESLLESVELVFARKGEKMSRG